MSGPVLNTLPGVISFHPQKILVKTGTVIPIFQLCCACNCLFNVCLSHKTLSSVRGGAMTVLYISISPDVESLD